MLYFAQQIGAGFPGLNTKQDYHDLHDEQDEDDDARERFLNPDNLVNRENPAHLLNIVKILLPLQAQVFRFG